MRLPCAIFLELSLGFWLPCLTCLAQSETRQHDLHGVKGLQKAAEKSRGANGSATMGPLQPSNHTSRAPGNWASGFNMQREINRPLSLAGYDGVYLNNRQQWKRGLETVATDYDGQRYLFFNERQRAIFLAAPHQYAPVLGGHCVVTFVESGRRVIGDLKYSVLYQHRIYLFTDADQRKQFQDAPDKFRNADLANAGNCPVILQQQQRWVVGVPATLHIHDGFRYWFSSMAARKEFLKSPNHYVRGVSQTEKSQLITEAWLQVKRLPMSAIRSAEASASQSGPLVSETPQSRDGTQHLSKDSIASNPAQKRQADKDETLLPDAAKLPLEQLAMGGYCPVSIQGDGQEVGIWVEGRATFRTNYDGKIYQFAGAREKQRFVESPEKFIPAFGGDCVVCQKEQGTEINGSIFHAAIYPTLGGRLFLFTDKQHKEIFKQNPAAYNQMDLALNGNCVVSQREEGRQVTGSEKYLTWYQNRRYLFVSSKYRQIFIDSPEDYITR